MIETPKVTIQMRFTRFHARNPIIYQTLVFLARKAKARGAARIGIGHLWEVMRWTLWIESGSRDSYKMNNNFRSRYARLIMDSEPDLVGIFETRRIHTA